LFSTRQNAAAVDATICPSIRRPILSAAEPRALQMARVWPALAARSYGQPLRTTTVRRAELFLSVARKNTRAGATLVLACLVSVMCTPRAHAQSDAQPDALPGTFETVVVAPRAEARASEDLAAASSVISADRTPRSAETASELLSELPGTNLTQFGGLGALATVSLRGSTAEQVGVYVDGVPLNAAVGAGVDLGQIPLTNMQQLEVYRGMSPIGFGASALGGVVSLTTQDPTHDRAAVQMGGGSFGTGFGGFHTSLRRDTTGLGLGLNLLRTAGTFSYRDDQGNLNPADDVERVRRNNHTNQSDGYARYLWDLGQQRRLTVSLWALDRTQGLASNGRFQIAKARMDVRRLMTAARFTDRSLFGPGGQLVVQLHGVTTRERLIDSDGELQGGPRRTRDQQILAGTFVRGRGFVAPWLRVAGIMNVRHERYSPRADVQTHLSGPPADRFFAAAGVEGLFLVRALNLDVAPSVRFEVAHDDLSERQFSGRFGARSTQDHALPILRLALLQRPTPWLAFKANVGRYARLPSLRERFGTSALFRGNSSLIPESGTNFDVGALATWSRDDRWLRLQGVLFAAQADDLIQLVQGGYYTTAQNISAARIRGAEFDASAALGAFRFRAQMTLTDARDASDILARRGKQLPLRPRFRANLRPEIRGVQVLKTLYVGAYASVDHVSGNAVDPANLVQLPARTLLGAGASVTYTPWGLRLIASARNLTDARVFDFVGFPLPGRSIFLTADFSTDALQPPSRGIHHEHNSNE